MLDSPYQGSRTGLPPPISAPCLAHLPASRYALGRFRRQPRHRDLDRSGKMNINNNRREAGPLQAIAPGPVQAITLTRSISRAGLGGRQGVLWLDRGLSHRGSAQTVDHGREAHLGEHVGPLGAQDRCGECKPPVNCEDERSVLGGTAATPNRTAVLAPIQTTKTRLRLLRIPTG